MSKIRRTKIPRKASGIYQIRSKINGKIYIGSACNLNVRMLNHLNTLKREEHVNPHLQYHINKYGIKDLRFSILEFCPKNKLIEREQYYIDILQPDFNICKIAGSSLGIKRSEETKQRMRASNIGKQRTEEARERMREAHIGKKFSEEHKQKLRDAWKRRKNDYKEEASVRES